MFLLHIRSPKTKSQYTQKFEQQNSNIEYAARKLQQSYKQV